MSIDATRWAWQQNLSPTRKLLLLALADRASERHDCYPSIIRLKADTGLYEKTIKEALQELEKLGLLAIERRPGESSVYRLIGVPDRHQKAVKNQTHEEGEKAPHQGGGKPPSPESEGGGKAPHCGVEKHPTGGVEKHPLNLSVEPITEPKERGRYAQGRAPTPTLPDWIDPDLWEAFKAHRQQIKKPMTEQAAQLNLRCLGKIRELGQDPNEVIETTIANGWTGLNWAIDRATNRGKTNEPHQRIDNSAPARVKRAEAAERIRERSALLDASPILCLAINTETEELVINGMDQTAPDIRGWNVWPRVNERGLLLALRSWLDQHTGPETVIVGHNIRGFDLPKLRHAYLRHRLKLPALLAPRINDSNPAPTTVDTAALFKAYSMEHRDDFCPSLDAVSASLGITRPKGVINGADVPALHRAGNVAEILTYCAIDCATTARAYRLMSGQAEDLE